MLSNSSGMARRVAALALGLGLAAGAARAESAAFLAVDLGSGAVIAESRGGAPHHPASLTKMMTAYVAFAAIKAGKVSQDDVITVSERAASQGGASLDLRPGERITLGAALKAMIVRSANDAAVAVAEHVGGSESAFASRMTEEAARLGMTSSSFRNASGMTAGGHVSSPRDMAVLAMAIERDFPTFRPLFSSRDTTWKGRVLPTVNGFLGAYAGAEGMKTGFTCSAGYNLVAIAHRGGRRALAVVMGAESSAQRLGAIRRLMDQALQATPTAGRPLAGLSNGGGAPPDHSMGACGYARGGKSGAPEMAIGPRRVPPGGWGLEVAFGRDLGKVRRDLDKAHREMRGRLGGGSAMVVIKPRDGMLRYRGLIVGLPERRAIDTCLAERARAGEERCMVLNPTMLAGALDDERRFKMISAH
ncbi:D-alanyl-D-alanine carboxypeptidase family protein [Paramagnetospirillum magneticum]|uniref:D-alanyl-D-alanine carboxypeptidase n=1 Tax=Paramagnetospirillum magneticum (strain ATCC 700264 / AMB-1) TaxID=342108 RepID=Q2W539_PARM1|nr:D-alanyl-D-alanine carboxypeptidase family protein [Paramagnetospirillum magneticum]BAE51036.1 D-alanyl-D-alanine carboxypeptidase [Paramagnetospirillum magneticum AMB-1]